MKIEEEGRQVSRFRNIGFWDGQESYSIRRGAVALLSYSPSATQMIESRSCAAKLLTAAEQFGGAAKESVLTKCNEKDILLDSAERPSAGF